MAKATGIIIAIALVALAVYGGTGLAIVAGIVVLLHLLGVLKYEGAPSKVLNIIALVAIIVVGGFIPAEWGTQTPALTVPSVPSVTAGQPTITSGTTSAILKYNAKANLGGTFATTAFNSYALKPGEVADRYALMKMAAEGDTSKLNGKAMSLTTGVYSYAGYSGKVGDSAVFCGYTDNTPAQAENISFCKTVTLTGLEQTDNGNAWTISEPTITIGTYATGNFKDTTDTSKVKFTDYETATVTGRHYKFSYRPTVLGESLNDATLFVQSSSSNSSYITKIKVTNSVGDTAETTALQDTGNMANNNPSFLAAPAINSSSGFGLSTDKMYYAVDIPNAVDNGVYTGSSHLGQVDIDVTANHPAIADSNVTFMFYVVQNAKALTSTGGHFESGGQNAFTLALNEPVGESPADAWS